MGDAAAMYQAFLAQKTSNSSMEQDTAPLSSFGFGSTPTGKKNPDDDKVAAGTGSGWGGFGGSSAKRGAVGGTGDGGASPAKKSAPARAAVREDVEMVFDLASAKAMFAKAKPKNTTPVHDNDAIAMLAGAKAHIEALERDAIKKRLMCQAAVIVLEAHVQTISSTADDTKAVLQSAMVQLLTMPESEDPDEKTHKAYFDKMLETLDLEHTPAECTPK
jgi:hypothetical protein